MRLRHRPPSEKALRLMRRERPRAWVQAAASTTSR